MRRICRLLPLTLLLLCCFSVASAQSLIDVNIGFGAAQASTNGAGIEGDYTGLNSVTYGTVFGGVCSLTAGDSTCAKTTALSSFMLGLGANLMLWKHFGVGMEAVLQPGRQTYASVPAELYSLGGVVQSVQAAYPLQTRTTFYDFNGIYQPVSTKRASLQLVGGIGGTNFKSYLGTSTSGSLLGNSNYSSYLSSANHFNVHAGVGVQIYLTDHIYVRPQFDIHYVPNFVQFSTNLVKEEMVWIGYTIGDRQ